MRMKTEPGVALAYEEDLPFVAAPFPKVGQKKSRKIDRSAIAAADNSVDAFT